MRRLWAGLLVLAIAHGQRPSPAAVEPLGNLPIQEIGAGDLLAISVYDSPELTRTVRVSPDGNIRLPMLHQEIHGAGLFPGQLENKIVEALQRENLLVSPIVTVTINEYHSRPISVMGAVRKPITFQALSPVRLLEALAQAEGLTSDAGAIVVVTQAGGNVRRIPVSSLIDGADAGANVLLSGGEEIRVPVGGHVFVLGNIKKPGVFGLHDGADATLMQMLALAEGLAPSSSKQAYVYRRQPDGTRTEIALPLDRILKRKQPDVAIFQDDILYIPANNGRRVALATLERVLAFGSSAGATALIYNLH
jgi:polysaccharide export outer membrane protein